MRLRPTPVRRDLESVTVWSGLRFEGVPARAIRALKEESRTGLARDLAPALRSAVDGGGWRHPGSRSRPRARRSAVGAFASPNSLPDARGSPLSALLRARRRTADQRGLDLAGRRATSPTAFTARDAASPPRHRASTTSSPPERPSRRPSARSQPPEREVVGAADDRRDAAAINDKRTPDDTFETHR